MLKYVTSTIFKLIQFYIPERIQADGNFVHQFLKKQDICRYMFAAHYVKNKRTLNVACGDGYSSGILAKGGAKKVYGVDINREVIQRAKERYKKKCTFSTQDAHHLQFEDNFFDCTISFETIEHLKHPHTFLKELKRVTKPGSYIIISTPNGRISKKAGFCISRYHLKEYTTDEMKSMLNKHFKVVSTWHQYPFSKSKPLLPLKIIHAFFFRDHMIIRRKKGISGCDNIFVCKNEK